MFIHICRGNDSYGNTQASIFFTTHLIHYFTIDHNRHMGQTKTFYNKADQDIIDSLLLSGIDKRRGEDQLFNNYAYFIREGMHKYSLTEDEAFDAYSDTILSAIHKITDGSFEGRSSLKTYLFQIYQNKCVDLLRKKRLIRIRFTRL